jgi:transcription initiation factor TFIIIB Brf1 subunit/transcription initiation factor TFIIB
LIIRDSRSPYIVRAGSSTPKKRKEPFHFCRYCGCETVYLEAYYAFLCQKCGAIVEEKDPEEQKAIEEQKRQQTESTYSIADGSAIYNPETYTRTNIRHGKIYPMSGGSGRTVSIKRSDTIIDKLRMKDGRTPEMDAIFKAQDEQLTARGQRILSDRLELRRSSNVKSSDELRAEKSGNVDLSGVGKYNPITGRRTRLSF